MAHFWRSALRSSPRTVAATTCAVPAAYLGDRHTRCDSSASSRITCFGEAMLRYIPDTSSEAAPSSLTTRWLKSAGGAELNVTVALSQLGWGGRAKWVSVVPQGALGDELLQLTSSAYVDGEGKENLELVVRKEGDVGIFHVWPQQRKVWYQRYRSVFGQMDADWFSESFWREVLTGSRQLHVLHLTGITPLVSSNTHKAWWRALRVARSLKEDMRSQGHPRLVVTMDFNHRPALGSWDDLWLMTEPHLATLDLLVFSIGDVIKLGKLLNIPVAADLGATLQKIPQGPEGKEALDAACQHALRAVQSQLGNRTAIAVCCKSRADVPEGELPLQLRFSMVALKTGEVVSTADTALLQRVHEEIGGGDTWLSGVIDGLAGAQSSAAVAPGWSTQMWRHALERGDMLSALKQTVVGDFCPISKARLEDALARRRCGTLGVVGE